VFIRSEVAAILLLWRVRVKVKVKVKVGVRVRVRGRLRGGEGRLSVIGYCGRFNQFGKLVEFTL
jgi:hypothetical protein